MSAQFNDRASDRPAHDVSPRGSLRPYDPCRRLAAALASSAMLAVLLSACGAGTPTRPAERAPQAAASQPGVASGAAAEPASEAARKDYDEALAAMQRGDDVEAELRLEQMMAEYPHLPGPYVNAAIVYRQSGRDADARAALEQALAIDPGHGEANNELGILLREAGEFAAAEAAYRRAIEADPAYLPPLYNLGVLLDLYLHRREEALECYENYQRALGQPDETVARWIIDLRRRVDTGGERVALRETP